MRAVLGPFVRSVVLATAVLVAPAAGAVAAGAPTPARTAVAVPTQFADDGLGLEGTSTYTVDTAARAIHVVVDLVATNLVPPSYGAYVIRYAYFDQIGLPVLTEAANLVATSGDGTPLGVTVETEPGDPVSFAVIDLPTALNYEDTQQLRLAYDLPDQGPRGAGITRVNPAYSAVVPLAVGDPGHATVRVVVPEGLAIEQLGGSTLTREPGATPTSFAAAGIADPITWDATLVARDDDELDRTVVDGDHDIEVRSWPDDRQWSDFVVGHVRYGLPVLEELIGQDWPVDRTLRIEETVSPYVYGYAGWYDSTAETIEIGDELDPAVVLHELSHAWFNRDLFAERWISEGFAEEYAARTIERLGQPLPQPEPVDPADPGVIRLADWSTPSLSSETSDDQEHYGYNTAFSVVRALYDEIGAEGLARVIDAAADDRIAYQGDPAAERDRRPTGWRRFLDLVEELGGSQQAGPLFASLVVPEADLPLLTTRGGARTALAALEEAGAGWTAPLAVRRALAEWDFTAAAAATSQAHAVLGVRDRIVEALAPLGLGAPAGLEEDYESADDLDEVLASATELLGATDELVDAAQAVDGGHDLWARLGLAGGSGDRSLDAAVAAFVAADADEALAAAARTRDVVGRADDRGRAAAAAGALALVVGWFVQRTARSAAGGHRGWRGRTRPGG